MESAITMEAPEIIMYLIPLFAILLILTVLLLLWYSGVFIPPDIKTCKPPFQELEVAYKFVRGSHKDCSLLYAEAHALASQLRCIGIYYDNPKETGDSFMRSIVGLILSDEDNRVSDYSRQRMLGKGFQITKFPAVEHVVYADIPHTSFISALVAVHKIIPSFRAYIQERKLEAYPLIEICDGRKIVYLAPLSKQSEFFVYEALAESEEEITSERTGMEEEESKDAEETLSSLDSLVECGSKVEELLSSEMVDSLEGRSKENNGSEASTESFEELQLDS